MLVLPVFLTRHSSIKVRRENDCKGKTQILKIKKKKQYYQTLTIITKAFIRFQYILTCWHGSLICSPLEVTSVFTLFVASLFSSLLSFSTCGASSSCIFRSNAARQQAQGTYWIRYRRYDTFYYLNIEKMYDLTFVIIEKVCNLLVFIIEKVYLCNRNI